MNYVFKLKNFNDLDEPGVIVNETIIPKLFTRKKVFKYREKTLKHFRLKSNGCLIQ